MTQGLDPGGNPLNEAMPRWRMSEQGLDDLMGYLKRIEDYTERGATDRALELTSKPAEALSDEEREEVLCTFFDAHWHNQIFPHPRYKELFIQRREARP